jgi:uncharacterized protein
VASTSLPAPQLALTPDEARLITLRAQGLIGTEGRHGGVPGVLRLLGAVQLDTISVLARSHELVAYARLGAIGRERVERAYWHPRKAAAFEYWSHAACVLPIEEWPSYAFRRRALRARGMRWHRSHPDVCARVLARIQAEGPLTATELGGAKNGGAWWDWSDTKIAVEWLLDTGEVICARRTGWRRVYDLPERVLPGELLHADPSDSECLTHLAAVATRALGVATRADLADYQRLRYGGTGQRKDGSAISAEDAAQAAGLIPVEIVGLRGAAVRAWADPAALGGSRPADGWGAGGWGADGAGAGIGAATAGTGGGTAAGTCGAQLADAELADAELAPVVSRGRHRTTLLSPFDSLIWDRKRTLRTFGFEHTLEAYLPPAKRVHGYFTMPLLAGGRLVGRVDPVRSGRTLIARKLTLDKAKAAEPMARALTEAAAWVGCDNVQLGQVEPPRLEGRLRSALAATGA